jgi:hypothetical protein
MRFKVGDKVMTRDAYPIYGKIADAPSPEGTYAVYACDLTGCHVRFINTERLMPDFELNKWVAPEKSKYEEIAESLTAPFFKEKETAAKPKRYNNGNLEVWDAIEQLGLGYKEGCILKYIARFKDKNGAEDLKKAMNYLAKMLAEETGEDYYELRKKSLDEL